MSRRTIVFMGMLALALAALQLLGVAMDAVSTLWRFFVREPSLARGALHLLLALAETAVAACWLIAGIALLRGRNGIWGRLVVLLVTSLAISMLETTWKLAVGSIDVSQTVSIGLGVTLGVLLALPSTREALRGEPPA